LERSPVNLCTACNEDFSSVEAFSRHRVGKHEYDWSPEREDGRRCLSVEEIEALGWKQNERGGWFDPVRSSRAESLGGRPGALARGS
jgi:hypothetical protein